MSDPGLFIAGLVVTLIVATAIALLVYAAVLDGRYDDERRGLRDSRADAEPTVGDIGSADAASAEAASAQARDALVAA